jgi:hypothetical protein
MDEGPLSEEQVELLVDTREDLGNSSGVRQHADGAVGLGQLAAGNDGGLLLVDSALESSGRPIYKLNGRVLLDGGDGIRNILRDNVSAVHEASGHVLALTRIAIAQHVLLLESGLGDLSNAHSLALGLLGRNKGSVRASEEVNARVRYQVGLEFVHVDVKGTLKSQGAGKAGDDLSDDSVEVAVRRTGNVEVPLANIVDGFVIEHESNICMFQQRVGGQDRVVGFYDGSRDLRGRINAKVELRLLGVVLAQMFEEQRSEARTSTATYAVEDQKSL